jgi:hypothetical protein
MQLLTQFTEAKRVHKHAVAAVNKARTDLATCIERTAAARQDMEGPKTAASVAKTDAQKYKPQVVADARAMLVADKELKQRRWACLQLAAALVHATTAKQLAAKSLTTAQAADAAARKARASSGTQPVITARPPLPLPMHRPGTETAPATVTQTTQPESPPIPPAAPAEVVSPPPAVPPACCTTACPAGITA